jgi:hypothetical protein
MIYYHTMKIMRFRKWIDWIHAFVISILKNIVTICKFEDTPLQFNQKLRYAITCPFNTVIKKYASYPFFIPFFLALEPLPPACHRRRRTTSSCSLLPPPGSSERMTARSELEGIATNCFSARSSSDRSTNAAVA